MGFSADVSTFIKNTKLRADLVLRKIAFDALLGVLLKSPVDTGRFRASWRVGINRVDLTVEPDLVRMEDTSAQGPAGPTASQQSTINKAKFGDTISITNNVEYAEFLENGASDQAPQGVLKVTFEEIKDQLRRIVNSI